jgi:hypothetical protein
MFAKINHVAIVSRDLRAAFHAAVNDPGFIAEAKRQHLEVEEVDGSRVAGLIADAYALPADIITTAAEIMNGSSTRAE